MAPHALELEYADSGIAPDSRVRPRTTYPRSIDLNRTPYPPTLPRHFTPKWRATLMSGEGIGEGICSSSIVRWGEAHGDSGRVLPRWRGVSTLKRICFTSRDRIILMPSNRRYRPIEVTPDNDFMCGVVTYTIKANRRRPGHRNQPMVGLIDCDNFFCSCERCFARTWPPSRSWC